MRGITNGWLEHTSWLLPSGATVNALPPPLQPGEHKRSGEGACWSARCSTTTAEIAWILHCIISLSLSPLHHLPLPFQGWATALFSIVPYNFLPTPHLLPSPSSLLSALPCLSLLVCRRESKHWKAFAYCLSRTGRDNYQSIKVNEISRYADEQGIGSLILWRVSNFMSPWVVMGWCLKKWMIALFHASKKTPQSR